MLSPLNVLHELEVGALGLDFLHGSRGDFVDQVAENDAVPEDIFVGLRWQFLSYDLRDPGENLRFLFLVPRLSRIKIREYRHAHKCTSHNKLTIPIY